MGRRPLAFPKQSCRHCTSCPSLLLVRAELRPLFPSHASALPPPRQPGSILHPIFIYLKNRYKQLTSWSTVLDKLMVVLLVKLALLTNYIDGVRTSQETLVWASKVCYGDSFFLICL
jgi:hypothetical protein